MTLMLHQLNTSRIGQNLFNTSDGSDSLIGSLIDDAQVAGIVGPLNSSVALAEMPLANNANIAMISPANTNPCLTKSGADVGCSGVDDILATEERQAANNLFAKIGVEDGMVLSQELLKVVEVGGSDIGVQIGDVRDEVNKIVEFLVIFAGGGGRGRDEDLPLGVVCEPLVVKLLGIGSGGGGQGVSKQKRLTTRAAIDDDDNNNKNNSLGIPPDLVLQTDQVSVDLLEGGHLSLGHRGGWRRTVF